jgi:REP element-mobilizing transposase RayT
VTYNPEIHHRRSIRLKGFDYTRQGFYFITICLQEKECLFGGCDFRLHSIILNEAGEMAARWYYELHEKYPDKNCREMVVMPNHVHFIVENTGDEGAHVGAPLRGRPPYDLHNQLFNAPIANLVDWYKTMTTNEYIHGVKQHGWKRFNGRLWQRNYYEHIIRSDEDYDRIADYIRNNPLKWTEDRFYC